MKKIDYETYENLLTTATMKNFLNDYKNMIDEKSRLEIYFGKKLMDKSCLANITIEYGFIELKPFIGKFPKEIFIYVKNLSKDLGLDFKIISNTNTNEIFMQLRLSNICLKLLEGYEYVQLEEV